MDNPFQSPAILSICTGMRGLERGIERAIGEVRTLAYVEIEAFIIYNLVAQMEQGVLAPAPVWSNLKTLPAEQFHERIHGIVGGYPCQPFSVAGNRKGEEDPRHLWPYIRDHVRSIKPIWCFFENVPGHINLGFETVKRELEELHYTVEAGIYSAEEVGAPHRRERLFILALENTMLQRMRRGNNELAERGRTLQAARSGYVDNTCSNGFEQGNTVSAGRNRFELTGERWPARPGEDQHEWEAPRTESSMGFTVNGYNYREDLLRMAGNGVVEHCAEAAWKDLFRKFNQRIS